MATVRELITALSRLPNVWEDAEVLVEGGTTGIGSLSDPNWPAAVIDEHGRRTVEID